jgi:hypothetical protein
MKSNYIRAIIILASLLIHGLPCFSQNANADFLLQIAKKNKITILIDGHLPDEIVPFSKKSGLKALADALKCDIELRDGVCLLRKTYLFNSEFPSVTIDEMRSALSDINKGIDKFAPSIDISKLEKDRYHGQNHTIFGDRLCDLVSGKSGAWVPIASLEPQAVTLIGQLHNAFATTELRQSTQGVLTSLNAATRGALVTEGNTGTAIRLPLASGNVVYPVPGEKPQPKSAVQAEIMTLENWQKQADPDHVYKINVDPSLREKIFTVIGEEYSTPLKQLRAIATLFDLAVKTSPERNLLTRKSRKLPQTLDELRDFAMASLPLPLTRAFRSEHGNIPVRTWTTLLVAHRRLSTRENRGTVSVTSLDPREKNALALWLSEGAIGSLTEAQPPSPLGLFAGKEQQLEIKVENYTSEEGKLRRRFALAFPRPDGTKVELFGMSNLLMSGQRNWQE